MRRILLGTFVAIILILLSSASIMKEEHRAFASHKLEDMAKRLPLRDIPSVDTIMEVPEFIKGKAIVFNLNNNKVVHMGLSLFSRETKEMIGTDICNFLERYFLELLLLRDKTSIIRKLTEDHIELLLNGQKFGAENFSSLQEVMQNICMPVNFSLFHKDQHAEAVWMSVGMHLQMKFPLYRELIDGMDKKESDEGVYNLLRVAVCDSIYDADDDVSYENLVHKTGNVYVYKGETFMIKSLTSDRYYMEENGKYHLIFTPMYPEYSMNNLFLSYQNGAGKTLLVTHRQYGYFTPEFTIPLNNFLACFKNDFLVACHTGYNKQNELETIVVFKHKILNYIHLLRVHVNKEKLFINSPVLKADFYSNIPQHYISSLLK